MKTIAITIDEPTLRALDGLASGNRSELVRRALQEFIARRKQAKREQAEWALWKKHLDRINRQAAALVSEQAEP